MEVAHKHFLRDELSSQGGLNLIFDCDAFNVGGLLKDKVPLLNSVLELSFAGGQVAGMLASERPSVLVPILRAK